MNKKDQKIAIAEALRHIKTNLHPSAGDVWNYSTNKGVYNNKSDCDTEDYINDANTWPEMLKALSLKEYKHFLSLLENGMQPSYSYGKVVELLVVALELTQPQRAELWLKAQNLWKE